MIDLRALLSDLCAAVPDRRLGSPGNAAAVDRVASVLEDVGWEVRCPTFPVMDWEGEPGSLTLGARTWPAVPSPYALGWRGRAPVRAAATEADLDRDLEGAIALLHGDLASAPLTPTGYPFYSSERDSRIVSRLESSGAVAVLAITGRCPELAGSVDPFPLIEDGSFSVPAGALTEEVGQQVLETLADDRNAVAGLDLPAHRWPSSARNIVARRGADGARITIVAHIDTKPGTPGALDNAAGVVTLCRVAELLAHSTATVELLVVNGEDHYSAAGEQAYLGSADLSTVRLAVNIDGAGLPGGPTAWSAYGVPDEWDLAALTQSPDLVPGPPWPQSDHMVFAMAGRPAIALTSADFATVMEQVAHSPDDTPAGVDVDLLDRTAVAIARLVEALSGQGGG